MHFNVTLFMQATTTPSIFIAKMVQYKMNLCRKNLNDVVNEGRRLQIMEANEGWDESNTVLVMLLIFVPSQTNLSHIVLSETSQSK